MEVEGTEKLFGRSETTWNVRYKHNLGDGYSRGFQSVVESQSHGKYFMIEKLECAGHFQKRFGGILGTLQKH